MTNLYFAFAPDGRVVITPKKLWDDRGIWDTQGTEAREALRRHGIPLLEDTEGVFGYLDPKNEVRRRLLDAKATENADLLAAGSRRTE